LVNNGLKAAINDNRVRRDERTGELFSYARTSEALSAPGALGRFEFTFTPKHAPGSTSSSCFFSKFARSVLRHIRVASKHELKERIMAGIEDVNRHPVIHTWSYKLAEAA